MNGFLRALFVVAGLQITNGIQPYYHYTWRAFVIYALGFTLIACGLHPHNKEKNR